MLPGRGLHVESAPGNGVHDRPDRSGRSDSLAWCGDPPPALPLYPLLYPSIRRLSLLVVTRSDAP